MVKRVGKKPKAPRGWANHRKGGLTDQKVGRLTNEATLEFFLGFDMEQMETLIRSTDSVIGSFEQAYIEHCGNQGLKGIDTVMGLSYAREIDKGLRNPDFSADKKMDMLRTIRKDLHRRYTEVRAEKALGVTPGHHFRLVEGDDTVDLKGGETFRVLPKDDSIIPNVPIPLKKPEPFKDSQVKHTMDDALAEFMAWLRTHPVFKLQANECSRLHLLRKELTEGLSLHVSDTAAMQADAVVWPWDKVQTFVVKHDWAGVMSDHLEGAEFTLPYPACAFEFKVNGRVMVVLLNDHTLPGTGKAVELSEDMDGTFFVEGYNGVWMAFDTGKHPDFRIGVFRFLFRQVVALCAVLESKVAETQVVRQPTALNTKRLKNGKLPLHDYHVVDLSRRHRAARNPNPEASGRKVRMHFRRGHWRHYPNHKTWIEWMLVGDPDLGFIEKEYRL